MAATSARKIAVLDAKQVCVEATVRDPGGGGYVGDARVQEAVALEHLPRRGQQPRSHAPRTLGGRPARSRAITAPVARVGVDAGVNATHVLVVPVTVTPLARSYVPCDA